MKRREFLKAPALAAGSLAGLALPAWARGFGRAVPGTVLLRLDDTGAVDGTASGATGRAWLPYRTGSASGLVQARVIVQELYLRPDSRIEELDLGARFLATGGGVHRVPLFAFMRERAAAGKPRGFDAPRGTFAGLHVKRRLRGVFECTRHDDLCLAEESLGAGLEAGLYMLLLDRHAPMAGAWRHSGDARQPLVDAHGRPVERDRLILKITDAA